MNEYNTFAKILQSSKFIGAQLTHQTRRRCLHGWI